LVAGNNDVIDGWEIALNYLGRHSKASIIIPSYLAYGEKGSGNDILPNSVLFFDLEIMEIKRKQKIKSSF
jgi:FKBP-type peptidyl-prolyl cis-trans isomerase